MYGSARFLLEFVRQPDAGLEHLWWGLTMGQTLSLPMILVGLPMLVHSVRHRASAGPSFPYYFSPPPFCRGIPPTKLNQIPGPIGLPGPSPATSPVRLAKYRNGII